MDMGTKTFQFFCRRDELLEILSQIVNSLSLKTILYSGGRQPRLCSVEQLDQRAVARFQTDRVYLSAGAEDIGTICPDEFSPARLGWVQVDLPREVDDQLLLAQVATKTDWYNPETDAIAENKEVVALHKKITSLLKKHVTFPVWAYNVKHPEPHVYHDIGFSRSAREFANEGGELVQEGVDNVRFTIEKPDL